MMPVTDNLLAPLLDQLDEHFAERLLRLDAGQQALREAGSGETVVLLHGIGSGAASWLQVAMGLSQRARVIAWDAPGYGQSTPLSVAKPNAQDYAGRLLQMLDTLAVERCLLVGHSLGALTAAAFAQAHPQRVRRLVLLSPARGYGAPEQAAQGLVVRDKRLHSLEQLGIAAMARERSAHLLSPTASAQALAWVQWNMARLLPHGYRQAIDLLCGDYLVRYSARAVPCEVHCGNADGITRPDDCQALAAAMAAPFSLIEGAGHACAIEQPQTVTELLARALDASLTGSAQ
ncbi:pimeloyl-ACP methyl ester carboxylesterase [Pseudomonas hunanensis]|uniref:Pimeloyl-ACP methyl ester carboxylesterase n=1 Tax=Pseudomonas hunanensis TaxID=1247546 RepID=A0ACC6K423_9PSED|nr:alpha/beta fold hydrolase [Pseudomonas hunanensis]MDR6713137.1 pimeloyl-ACP methyl ester carboxylesterase [Pseudomonas hunanensis]